MTTPIPFTPTQSLDARLVTKTSLSKPKQAIAALIMLWYAFDTPDSVEYGKTEGRAKDGGILDESTISSIEGLLEDQQVATQGYSVADLLSGNPLFESQMESLNAAFELVWHLASFEFTGTKNRGAERTGGIRYRKRIKYTTNLDLIDSMAGTETSKLLQVLVAWLAGAKTGFDDTMQERLVRMLTVFSERSFYKTSKGSEGYVYVPSGIYGRLLNGSATVDTTAVDEEVQGTTRILNNAIKDGLNLFLSGGRTVTIANDIDVIKLGEYSKRAETALALNDVEIRMNTIQNEKKPSSVSTGEPHNLIFFGAPGTGKSFNLDSLATQCFDSSEIRRVTFYPDYTYSQFVGSYKPFVIQDNTDVENGSHGTGTITYEFVSGPFLETYLDATAHLDKNYLLIIEEINRANPAAVFGDVFQLLDRDADGNSEYAITVPREMRRTIENEWLGGNGLEYDDKVAVATAYGFDGPDATQKLINHLTSVMALPPNMYIWATMNSADQGVFPMDTAFKRRWDFRYIGIDAGENAEVSDGIRLSDIEVDIAGTRINWNELRKAINKLLVINRVNEDKLIGPFFVKPQVLLDESAFSNAFKDKVLLYLFEDAAKMRRAQVFAKENVTYSQLCADFDAKGIKVFKGLDETKLFSNDGNLSEDFDGE